MTETTFSSIDLSSIKKLILAIFFAVIVSGCYSNIINLKIPFDNDVDTRLPLKAILYFPEENIDCNYSRRSLYKDNHPSINFDIAEMTVSFWPEVFELVFSNAEVSVDGTASGVQENTDIVIKVSCRDFWIDTYGGLPWSNVFDVYRPWTEGGTWIILDYVLEFSCPRGDQIGAYEIRGFSKLLYTEGSSYTGIIPPLKRKTQMTFQKAGEIFIEEVLPEIEGLASSCATG